MNTAVQFAVRAAAAGDAEFEQALYASTRDDLRPLGPEVFDGLVGMQFRALAMSIKLEHPNAERQILTVEGAPVGRLVTAHAADQTVLIDLALLPEFRGHGIGASVLRSVILAAERAGRRVQLQIDRRNRAVRLCERLGFQVSGETGLFLVMTW